MSMTTKWRIEQNIPDIDNGGSIRDYHAKSGCPGPFARGYLVDDTQASAAGRLTCVVQLKFESTYAPS